MYVKIKLLMVAAFCDGCKKDLHSYDGWPYIDTGDHQYCEKCALKTGVITPLEYANSNSFIGREYYDAEMKDGVIYARYKCKTKKGYRTDTWEPFYEKL